MESKAVSLALFGIVFIIAIQTSVAVKCYICNSGVSYDGEECATNPADNFLKPCDEETPRMESANFTICAKINQDVEGEYRTVRFCATEMPENYKNRCVERTGTHKIKMTYCNCDSDGCNAAPASLSINVFLLTAASAILAFIAQS